jgi:thiosulfate/3-mercaptopyruvate sulfurtransferase
MTDHILISAAGLEAALSDPRLLVVDCRFDLLDPHWGQHEYASGHIPGAVFASLEGVLSGPVSAATGRHPLPSPQQFAETLSFWGVTPETRIVVYDQGPGAAAARLWWMLRAVGRHRVQVLDGGLAQWLAGHRKLSRELPVRLPSVVSPCPYHGYLSTEEVQQALRGEDTLLVDARAADRFAGHNELVDPVAGHIPGARNHPFMRNMGPDGQFLPGPVLRESWLATLAGYSPERLVAMCGSGVTACHNLLALELAGLPGGKLYAGSWSEWIRDPKRPVATQALT